MDELTALSYKFCRYSKTECVLTRPKRALSEFVSALYCINTPVKKWAYFVQCLILVQPNSAKDYDLMWLLKMTFAHNINHFFQIICIGSRQEAKGFPILNDLALTAASCSLAYPEMSPDEDIIFLPYSTGTSGPRKGVAISHFVLNAMLKTFNK